MTNEFLENTNVEEIVKRGNQRSSLREIHRVSYLVQTITEESLLVPKGSFALNYNENLIYSKDYNNPWKELRSLDNYCVFKKPKGDSIMRYMALRSKDNNIDFLEDSKDAGSKFTILQDHLGVTYFVKSIVWPGFVGYLRANSNVLGFIYFGYGLKNSDLYFTLN